MEDPNWYSLVESSGWLAQVRLILLGAARVVEVIENEGTSVLVHCSDGWDRTSQVWCGGLGVVCDFFPHLLTFSPSFTILFFFFFFFFAFLLRCVPLVKSCFALISEQLRGSNSLSKKIG